MIYKTFQDVDQPTKFLYLFICIFIMFYFWNRDIGLNIVLALTISTLVIYFMYDKSKTLADDEQGVLNTKIDAIQPTLDTGVDSYGDQATRKDIIDFLYSIQDMYMYNPQAYEEMIDNINAFFKIYNYIYYDNVDNADRYYSIAVEKKDNACNALQSMVFTVPVTNEMSSKLVRSYRRLDTLLTNYINDIYDKCQENIVRQGLDVHKTVIQTGTKPYNNYDDEDYSYQFF